MFNTKNLKLTIFENFHYFTKNFFSLKISFEVWIMLKQLKNAENLALESQLKPTQVNPLDTLFPTEKL